MHPGNSRWRVSLTAISALLFAAALTQIAFSWGQSAASSATGWRVLWQGWKGLPGGYVEWLANPALFISWAAAIRARRFPSMASACAAAALMLVFLVRTTPGILVVHTAAAVSYGAGCWLWLGSALAMVVANLRGASI